jgi:hypothetical protein
MMDCAVVPPPTQDQILSALKKYPMTQDPWEARTLLLADYSSELLLSLTQCNKQMQKLRDWRKDALSGVPYDNRGNPDQSR